jgi:hypothetical protein
MNLYVTTEEIKTFMGISGTGSDTLLAMFNKMATSVVNGVLGVSDLSLHKVTDEVHDAGQSDINGQYLELFDSPIVAIGKIMNGDIEYTQEEDYDILLSRVRLDDWLTAGPRKTKVTYAAGYHSYGYAKISITDLVNLAANAIITLGAVASGNDGYTLTRGTGWNPAASSEAEAINLATAIQAQAGTNAFALGSDVYVIEGSNPQVVGRTITTSDSVRLALSGSTLDGLNFPESIRLAVMIYVANLMASRKSPKIKSYTIGSKTVSFASDAEFNQFNDLLKPFRKVGVKAV